MDTTPPSLRAQGIQALRDEKLELAIDLLARALMADSQDAEAQMFLGVAYSQKGLHAQAVRALETAVELRPQEARWYFNLGVAMEAAGDSAGAVNAYRAALRINPQHAQALARAQALAGQGTAPPPAAPPPAKARTPSPNDAPWLRGRESPAAATSGSLGAASDGPPGTVQCPQCHQWSKPGISCEWCSAALRLELSRTSATALASEDGLPGAGSARPFGVSLLVVLYDLGALCSILISVGLGLGVARTVTRPGTAAIGAVMAAVAAASILMALAMIIISYFLWMGCNWARIVIMALLALAMLGQMGQLLARTSPALPLLELAVSVLFLLILSSRQTREFCSR